MISHNHIFQNLDCGFSASICDLSSVCGGNENWVGARGQGQERLLAAGGWPEGTQYSCHVTPVLSSKAGGGTLIEKPEKYGLGETVKRWIAYCF